MGKSNPKNIGWTEFAMWYVLEPLLKDLKIKSRDIEKVTFNKCGVHKNKCGDSAGSCNGGVRIYFKREPKK